MIVKVQRSIKTTADREQVMVYNENRSVFFQGAMPATIRAIFDDLDNPFKFYARAHMDGTDVVIDNVVQDRSW